MSLKKIPTDKAEASIPSEVIEIDATNIDKHMTTSEGMCVSDSGSVFCSVVYNNKNKKPKEFGNKHVIYKYMDGKLKAIYKDNEKTINHLNDMTFFNGKLYIAPMNQKCIYYIDAKKTNQNASDLKKIKCSFTQPSGIAHYKSNLFFVKQGPDVFLCELTEKKEKKKTVKTLIKKKTYNVKKPGSNMEWQGMDCRGEHLYLVSSTKKGKKQVCYVSDVDLKKNKYINYKFQGKKSATTDQFEMEGVGFYDGTMYTVANRKSKDCIMSVKWSKVKKTVVFQKKISKEMFPDENFREYILSDDVDKNKNGYLSKKEIKGLENINVSDKNIENLSGVEYFKNVTTIYCDYNKLSSIDISKNTALEKFVCRDNHLSSLSLGNNSQLKVLDVCNNNISSLNVGSNGGLIELWADGNSLSSLNVSSNHNLQVLTIQDNNITSINIGYNPVLSLFLPDPEVEVIR